MTEKRLRSGIRFGTWVGQAGGVPHGFPRKGPPLPRVTPTMAAGSGGVKSLGGWSHQAMAPLG